jgi:predicted ATP-dependent protease
MIEVIPVRTLRDVLKYALVGGAGTKKDTLLERLAAMVLATNRSVDELPAPSNASAPPKGRPVGS